MLLLILIIEESAFSFNILNFVYIWGLNNFSYNFSKEDIKIEFISKINNTNKIGNNSLINIYNNKYINKYSENKNNFKSLQQVIK